MNYFVIKRDSFCRLVVRLPVYAAVLLGLNSCELGLRVRVDGDLSNPRFSFLHYNAWDTIPLCVNYLDVSKNFGTQSAQKIWFIYKSDGCLSERDVSYLGPNPGAVVRIPPQPLEAGVTYVVIASGSGISGGCAFVYRNGRYQMLKDRCP
jgi:hypothetical protein